jgi:hypothetical protein
MRNLADCNCVVDDDSDEDDGCDADVRALESSKPTRESTKPTSMITMTILSLPHRVIVSIHRLFLLTNRTNLNENLVKNAMNESPMWDYDVEKSADDYCNHQKRRHLMEMKSQLIRTLLQHV